MSRTNESFAEQIVQLPWWVGALLSVGSYFFIRFVVPSFFAGGSPMLTGAVLQTVPTIAGLFAFAFAGLAAISAIRSAIEKWKTRNY